MPTPVKFLLKVLIKLLREGLGRVIILVSSLTLPKQIQRSPEAATTLKAGSSQASTTSFAPRAGPTLSMSSNSIFALRDPRNEERWSLQRQWMAAWGASRS